MRRSTRFTVLWTLWMCGGGIAAVLIVYAVTRSLGWAIVGLLGSGVVLNAIGQAVVQPFEAPPKLPPVWFKHAFWRAHRALFRLSGGRFLWTPATKRGWGALHLTTTGRKSGRPRTVIVGYLEDGQDLIVLAMNGWDEGHPAWWLNLEAHPDAVVRLSHQPPRSVHSRPSAGEERERLWERWAEVDVGLDSYARGRRSDTPVVVLEPRDGTA